MFTVYGDESHDEAKERVFSVAGVCGSQQQWAEFCERWLNRTGGRIFHAADCESDLGDYGGSPHEENLRLYADLTRMVAASGLNGIAVSSDLIAYRELFPLDEALPGASYLVGFEHVVKGFAAFARQQTAVSASDNALQVEVVFDIARDRAYSAGLCYEHCSRIGWMSPYLADKVSFATRRTVGIQVADLVAREAMKDLDNDIGPVKRPPRKSFRALLESGRFSFNALGPEGYVALLRMIPGVEKSTGITFEDYDKWLEENGLQDSMTNRQRWFLRRVEHK